MKKQANLFHIFIVKSEPDEIFTLPNGFK